MAGLPAVTVLEAGEGVPKVKSAGLALVAQALTRLVTFIEPRPVARSNPVPAVKPDRIPLASDGTVTLQFGVAWGLFSQGTAIVPFVVSLKMQEAAGMLLELQLDVACAAASSYKVGLAKPSPVVGSG